MEMLDNTAEMFICICIKYNFHLQ